MCLILLLWRVRPDFPCVLAANRRARGPVSRAAASRRTGVLGRALAVLAMAGVAGCMSSRDLRSHELIGGVRPPIAPESVRVYLEPPAGRYEQIAVLHSSSRRSWSFTSQSKADVVIRRLQEEAASLGANGVLLHEIADQPGTAVDTRVGTSTMGPRGTVDLGIGVSTFTLQRYGSGIAIYLPP